MRGLHDEGVPARAALREAIAALQNLHALARSPRVGPKAIARLLPEVVSLVEPLGEQLERSLGLVETTPRHRAARDQLVALGRSLAASALGALARAAAGGADARSRLAIELELERLLPLFEGARELVDAVEASLEETPVDLDLRDLIDEACAHPGPSLALWGRTVPVTLVGSLASAPARLRPRTGRAVLVGAIGWVGRGAERGSTAAPVGLRVTMVGGRTYIELSAGSPDTKPHAEREIWQVPVSAPFDGTPGVLAWAAGLSGARGRFLRDQSAAVLLVSSRPGG
jgi:hypothetical protein